MILVVGSGRSGTSCIARLLHERLGVDFGGPGKIDKFTPEGGYARKGWMKPSEAYGEGQIGIETYKGELDPPINEMKEPWGFKHPYLSERVGPAVDLFRPDEIIWAWRDEEETMKSMVRHYSMDPENAYSQVQRRNHELRTSLHTTQYILINMTGHRPEDRLAVELYKRLEERNYSYLQELDYPGPRLPLRP